VPWTETSSPLGLCQVDRLRRFKDDLAVRERKMEMYKAGEDLFALPQTQYPELVKTKKEVQLLDQLYSLYVEVINSFENFKKVRMVPHGRLAFTVSLPPA
jgi:hypothetical protein